MYRLSKNLDALSLGKIYGRKTEAHSLHRLILGLEPVVRLHRELMQLLCECRDSTVGQITGLCVSLSLRVLLELGCEVITVFEVEDNVEEHRGGSKVPCPFIVALRELSATNAIAGNQAYSSSSVVSEAKQAGSFGEKKIVGRAVDELVVPFCKEMLLFSCLMHVFDESIDIVSDSSQVMLVLGFGEDLVVPVLQERGDGVDPFFDFVRTHEVIETKLVDMAELEAEQVTRGSGRSIVVLKPHDVVMSLLLASLVAGTGTGSGEQEGAFYGHEKTTTPSHQVTLSQILNGFDLNIHFSSVPVMVLETIALSPSLTRLMPSMVPSNNRFVSKSKPLALTSHTLHCSNALHSRPRRYR
jgi:hypothetical protein